MSQPVASIRPRPTASLGVGVRALGAAFTLGLTACATTVGATPPPMPPAEVYDQPPEFSGRWAGKVADVQGTLDISSIGNGVYRGVYRGAQVEVQYILKLEQTMRDGGDATPGTGELPDAREAKPTNRITFTWQDGRGGRGLGWLMINRGSSALTGAFGEGAGHIVGTWTFLRETDASG
ncbi:MAG: hypothetical protein JKY37_18630 [Nannocystaceae bacterium]|nr:hypothetical protein [Nannocystaceae bacterium]